MSKIKDDIEKIAAAARTDIGIVEAKAAFVKANAKALGIVFALGAALALIAKHYL